MNCQSHQCHQGRKPCTDQRCHSMPTGGPWDWINELVDRGVLVLVAIAIVASASMAYRIFH